MWWDGSDWKIFNRTYRARRLEAVRRGLSFRSYNDAKIEAMERLGHVMTAAKNGNAWPSAEAFWDYVLPMGAPKSADKKLKIIEKTAYHK